MLRTLVVGLLALGLTTPALARTLENALKMLSQRHAWSYVLGPGVELSLKVPEALGSEAELAGWLQREGITLRIRADGVRELSRQNASRVDLAALPIRADPLIDPPAPLRTGASQTRYSGSDAEALGDRQLDQLFARTANVFGSGDEFYFRGIPTGGDLNSLGNATAVLGETPLPNVVLANLPLSTWDLAEAGFERGSRAGVSAGPFGAYSGRIALTPQAPEFSAERRVRLAATELSDRQTALLLNQPLIPDELAARFSIDHQSQAGTLSDPNLGEELDFARSTHARGALRWEPAARPGWSLSADLDVLRGAAGPRRLAAADPFTREGRVGPFIRRRVDAQLGSLSARYEPSATDAWNLLLAGSRGQAALDPTVKLQNTFSARYPLIDRERSSLGFVQLTRRWTRGPARFSAGLSSGRNEQADTYLREERRWRFDQTLTRHTLAVNADVDASETVRIETGIRLIRDRLEAACEVNGPPRESSCLQIRDLLLTPADGVFEPFEESYLTANPELSVRYAGSERSEWFARLAQAYNAGGAISDATFDGVPRWIFFEPERARSAELGWRGRRGPAELTATAFYTQLSQQWSVVQGNVVLSDVSNDGQSRSHGIELDGELRLRRDHALKFSLGWLATRFDRFLPFESDALIQSAAGNRFPGAPRYSGSLRYLGRLTDAWQLGVGVSFYSEVEANANNPTQARIPGAAITDLRLAWQRGPLGLALTAGNLFDRSYHQTTPNLFGRFTGDPSEQIDYLPGRPRNVGLELTYQF
ncbi:MAG: TonB-dependent receptor [Pseudomonadota bacterium]